MRRILASLSALLLVSFTSPATGENNAVVINGNMTAAMKYQINQSAMEQDIQEAYQNLTPKPEGLKFSVFRQAMIGFMNMKKSNKLNADKSVISVVDFTKSSKDNRFWIIDIKSKKVLFKTMVAHGRNTGDDMPKKFSNQHNSFMSSVGFYKTGQTYFGKHGLSLKLHGQDAGFNSNAESRAVVIHGADYVSQSFVNKYGRLGRSLGCPALPVALTSDIINTIKNDNCLYIHGNEAEYASNFLNIKQIVTDYDEVKPELYASL